MPLEIETSQSTEEQYIHTVSLRDKLVSILPSMKILKNSAEVVRMHKQKQEYYQEAYRASLEVYKGLAKIALILPELRVPSEASPDHRHTADLISVNNQEMDYSSIKLRPDISFTPSEEPLGLVEVVDDKKIKVGDQIKQLTDEQVELINLLSGTRDRPLSIPEILSTGFASEETVQRFRNKRARNAIDNLNKSKVSGNFNIVCRTKNSDESSSYRYILDPGVMIVDAREGASDQTPEAILLSSSELTDRVKIIIALRHGIPADSLARREILSDRHGYYSQVAGNGPLTVEQIAALVGRTPADIELQLKKGLETLGKEAGSERFFRAYVGTVSEEE